MATAHNSAKPGQIAKTVLMPGDPLRAKFIAETFLENPVQFNSVRNMFGYTGTYKGKEVSVMGSGMGMPSIGIYSYELFAFYGVENIIRIGSAGSYTPEHPMYSVVVAKDAFAESTYAKVQAGIEENVLLPSEELNKKIMDAAERTGIPAKFGRIHSCDVFYAKEPKDYHGLHACDVVEMESFALFANANLLGKNAACLVTVSDTFWDHAETTAEERQFSFTNMMKIALEAAIAE